MWTLSMLPIATHLRHTNVHSRSGYSHFVFIAVLKHIFISYTDKYDTSDTEELAKSISGG